MRYSESITLFAAVIGCFTGVFSISWQLYKENENSNEELVIEWNAYPAPAYNLLFTNNHHLKDGLKIEVTNKSKNMIYIKSIHLNSTIDNCTFNYRLTNSNVPVVSLNPWSYDIFIFEGDMPKCINLYENETLNVVVKTSKDNNFSSTFNPIFGVFNKKGKFNIN
ncbi:hypothetical protein [Neptunomonas sp.]|uniref:eIF2A-related protein n=1 Tax=Neptunomonas sp. TaxID=1971898 RepID=UPI0025E16AB7|nr:hypothetical protein [Neptunomonas sp.]